MIDRNGDLPVSRQAKALGIGRGSVYYLPRPVSGEDLALMRRLDELHLEYPFAGSRMLQGIVADLGPRLNPTQNEIPAARATLIGNWRRSTIGHFIAFDDNGRFAWPGVFGDPR